jgi:hypothetical protein
MAVLSWLFWLFLVLAAVGFLPVARIPYAGFFLCLAVVMLKFITTNGLHL